MKFVTLVLCCLSLGAIAQTDNKALTTATKVSTDILIKQNLSKLGLQPVSIADSPVPGLYQVITNRGLFYFSDNAQYLIQGKVYDLKDGIENISEKALAQVRIDGVKQFAQDMIVYPAKNEKHKVTVFTDTSCGYCRKLHSQMAGYNELGITVQYMAFPRSGIHGSTFKELEAVWCADDQQKALTDVKNGMKMDAAKVKSCNAPIAAQYALGMQVGVSGTPAIILPDGSMIPGYQGPEKLFSALSAL